VANGDARATRHATADERWTAPRYAWSVLGAFLLLAAAIGIAAGTPPPAAQGGPWYRHGVLLGVGLEIALAVLFIVVRIIDMRSPRQGYPAVPLRKLLQQVIVVAMLLVGGVLIFNALPHRKLKTQQQSGTKTGLPKIKRHVPPVHALDLRWLPYALLALLAAAAIVACVLLILRLRRRPALRVGTYLDDFPDDSEELQRAVESGRYALRAVDDARAAIIACYLAMETSLAGAGTARADAETPDELLARAAAAGLVHGAAAGRLTDLFYEARYSTHGLPPEARDSAKQALDEISADLRGSLARAGDAGPGP
jgi:hypothetical protein